MKNRTMQMASRVLEGYPLLRDKVNYVLASHAVSPKVTEAIYGLLQTLEKTSTLHPMRIRHFRPTLQRVLLRLALQCPPGDFLRPQQYSNLNATDFSILSRWGLIMAGPKKGLWAPTELAFSWLLGRIPIFPAIIWDTAPNKFQAVLSEPCPVAQDLREFKDPTVKAQLQGIENRWHSLIGRYYVFHADSFLHPCYWDLNGKEVRYCAKVYKDQF